MLLPWPMPPGSRALGVPVHGPHELGFRAFGLSPAARVVKTRGSFGAFLLPTLHLCPPPQGFTDCQEPSPPLLALES